MIYISNCILVVVVNWRDHQANGRGIHVKLLIQNASYISYLQRLVIVILIIIFSNLFPRITVNGISPGYRKIPKSSPGDYIFQRPFLRGLSLQGNLRLKTDWASLTVWRKFTVFALFYFVLIWGQFPSTSAREAIDLINTKLANFGNIGFLFLSFWSLVAYPVMNKLVPSPPPGFAFRQYSIIWKITHLFTWAI